MHSVKLIYNGSEWELEWFGRQPFDADTFANQLVTNGQDYLAALLKGMVERNPPGALAMMKLLTDGLHMPPMAPTMEYEGRMRAIVQYRPRPTDLNSQGTVACGNILEGRDILLAHNHGRVISIHRGNESYRAGSLFNHLPQSDLLLELVIPPKHSLLQALFVEAPRLRVGGGSGIDTRPVSIQHLLDLRLAKHD